MECIRLRVHNIDFGRSNIFVRGGKGGKDRVTLLPQIIPKELQAQIKSATAVHHKDLEAGFGEVYLPNALAKDGMRSSLRMT